MSSVRQDPDVSNGTMTQEGQYSPKLKVANGHTDGSLPRSVTGSQEDLVIIRQHENKNTLSVNSGVSRPASPGAIVEDEPVIDQPIPLNDELLPVLAGSNGADTKRESTRNQSVSLPDPQPDETFLSQRKKSNLLMPGPSTRLPPIKDRTQRAPSLRSVHSMTAPGVSSKSRGLNQLEKMNVILIHQMVEMAEVLYGEETKNQYYIKNIAGEAVFVVNEESDSLHRQCLGASRGFVLHINDGEDKEVVTIRRNHRCCAGYSCFACSGCCAMDVVVETTGKEVTGFVCQKWSVWSPRFEVLDGERRLLFEVNGPGRFSYFACCAKPLDFTITDKASRRVIGTIRREYVGFVKQLYTKADNFTITLSENLALEHKILILGVVFLLDYMFFEEDRAKPTT